MLIGHHPLDSEDIVLDRLTTPQPEDRRHRRRFERDQAAHQRLLDHEWQLSGGKRTYLGEWHTHPELHPSPSHLDRRSWNGALRHTAFHGPGLVFIIVGTETVRLWFGSARGHRVQLLSIRAASPAPISPRRSVNMSTTHKNLGTQDTKFLWAAAGGRCQLCNKLLTESAVTFKERNIGERAHIQGQGGPGAPRHDPHLSPTLARSLGNIMLLCLECHDEIDSDQERFPAEMLQDVKRRHEERIRYLTSLKPKRTRVVALQTHILQGMHGGDPVYQAVTLHADDLHDAILPDHFPDQDHPNRIRLDLSTTESPSHWEQAKQLLLQKWNRMDLDELEHLSVFALGKMPAVVYFGRLLGSTRKLKVMNVQRGVPTRWKSDDQVPRDLTFEVSEPEPARGRDAVLVLSLSGTIELAQYREVMPPDAVVYEITIPEAHRDPDWLVAASQLEAFSRAYKGVLGRIQKTHGQDVTIHLIAAAPTPVLIEAGRQYRPNQHPRLLVYNCVNKRFSSAFELEG